MRIRSISIAVVLVCLALCMAARAQTAEEIVARNIAARGGAEKLNKLSTIRLTGTLDLGGGVMATLISEQKRPDLMRMDMIMGPIRAVRAYDGHGAWQFMPQMGQDKPQPMSAEDARDAIEEADFGGPLLNYKEKGHKIELLGREVVDGRDCYKLKVTLKSGDVRTYWIDAGSFLESRVEGARKTPAGEASFVQTLADYELVDGLMFPHLSTVEVKDPNGQSGKYIYKVEKIDVNPVLEDEHFKMPSEPPPTAPTTQR